MLTQERVKELFDYRDGDLYTKLGRQGVRTSKVAGSHSHSGYRKAMIAGKRYYTHRLVWMYHHGYFPEGMIDHIDKDPTNNSIENLREVSSSCNLLNAKTRENNSTGIKGVTINRRRRKFEVSYKSNRVYYGGDLLEAACHRLAAEQCDDNYCENESDSSKVVKDYLEELRYECNK